MHQKGVSAKEIQRILGHKDIQTTINVCVRMNEATLRWATDILDKAISLDGRLGERLN